MTSRQTIGRSAFNAGELSPRFQGRYDLSQYGAGLDLCLNGWGLVLGEWWARSGTRHRGAIADESKRGRITPFVFDHDDTAVLEWGDEVLRIWVDGGLVLDGEDPLEVATPYGLDELAPLQWVQSADVIFVANGVRKPQELRRETGGWVFESTAFVGGPFRAQNDTAVTVTADAQTGTVTLTASADIFEDEHVNGLFEIEEQDRSAVRPWEAGESVTADDLVRSDGKTYKALNTATTGNILPSHERGSAWDSHAGGVEWEYQHAGRGYGTITAVASATEATLEVADLLPASVVSGTSDRWAFGAWSRKYGFPRSLALQDGRLIAGGTESQPDTYWRSVANDFRNFAARNRSGEVAADQAITLTANSNQVNAIRWLMPVGELLIGTAGGELAEQRINSAEPLGAGNLRLAPQSGWGSAAALPVLVGDSVMFVAKGGRRLREMRYAFESDGYVAPDLTRLAQHITGAGIAELAWQQDPDSLLWAVRSDGRLACLTFEREQQVVGWSLHQLGGFSDAERTQPAAVESACVLPGTDGLDVLWLIVRRVIGGATRRTIETLQPRFDGTVTDLADAWFVDSGLAYDGNQTMTVAGLDHLAGETVQVLADGAVETDKVVAADGTVTLDRPANKAIVGLPYLSRGRTTRPELADRSGVTQGRRRKVVDLVMRLHETQALKVGGDFITMERLETRRGGCAADTPAPIASGDHAIGFPSETDRNGWICWERDLPLPATVLGFWPKMEQLDQ